MIFKWGDASNITLSSSFDNFSFHGDTTFPIKMQSMQMHITVKCVEEVQSTNHVLIEADGGGKRRLPAQKDSRTWLDQRWFSRSRRPHPSLKTIKYYRFVCFFGFVLQWWQIFCSFCFHCNLCCVYVCM